MLEGRSVWVMVNPALPPAQNQERRATPFWSELCTDSNEHQSSCLSSTPSSSQFRPPQNWSRPIPTSPEAPSSSSPIGSPYPRPGPGSPPSCSSSGSSNLIQAPHQHNQRSWAAVIPPPGGQVEHCSSQLPYSVSLLSPQKSPDNPLLPSADVHAE